MPASICCLTDLTHEVASSIKQGGSALKPCRLYFVLPITLGKLFHLFDPNFPHLQNGSNNNRNQLVEWVQGFKKILCMAKCLT